MKGSATMIFGYIRVSTDSQNFERQYYALKNCDYEIEERNILCDKKTGKDFDREQYQILKKIVRAGDTVVFPELSRFSRKYNEIADEMKYFQDAGVVLIFLDMPFLSIASDDLTQQLIADICIKLFSYVAEQERINTSKRIKEKLSAMKQAGIQLGRPKIILTYEQIQIMQQYIDQYPVKMSAKETADKMGININSFYKQLRLYKNGVLA